jgi:hypothetical protein
LGGLSFSNDKGTESNVSIISPFAESAEALETVSNASSELSAVLDALFSSSESAGDVNKLTLFCNLDNSFASFKTESCLSNHKAASSFLSTHSPPLKSS